MGKSRRKAKLTPREKVRQAIERVFRKAVKDQELRQALLANPREALTRTGIELPEGIEILVLEEPAHALQFVLPYDEPRPIDQTEVSSTEVKNTVVAFEHAGCGGKRQVFGTGRHRASHGEMDVVRGSISAFVVGDKVRLRVCNSEGDSGSGGGLCRAYEPGARVEYVGDDLNDRIVFIEVIAAARDAGRVGPESSVKNKRTHKFKGKK
jgi:hypothetical protein